MSPIGTTFRGMMAASNAIGPPLTVNNTASTGNASDLTVYTFSDVAIGTAAADRVVVIGVFLIGATGGHPTMTATIDGVGTTQAINDNHEGENVEFIHAAVVPNNTTADIVITASKGCSRCGLGVWEVQGGASVTATDTLASSADDPTGTIDVEAGGVIIGYATNSNNPVTTWTGITEDFDSVVFEDDNKATGASDAFAEADAGRTISATFTSGGSQEGMAVAAFR
tara:strand:+ start:1035 stop:1712 length:678 start_codon:yes stop_codon:yes gene_type:complete